MQTSEIASRPATERNIANHEQTQSKKLIEKFGDSIKVDDITYLECVIAFKRGLTFKWIHDVDKTLSKVFLKDQDFKQ